MASRTKAPPTNRPSGTPVLRVAGAGVAAAAAWAVGAASAAGVAVATGATRLPKLTLTLVPDNSDTDHLTSVVAVCPAGGVMLMV